MQIASGRRRAQQNGVDECCWNAFGLPVLYFVLFLVACWSLVYQFTSNQRLCDGETSSSLSSSVVTWQRQAIHQNSTTTTDKPSSSSVVTEEFVHSLFDKWTDALATGDVDTVVRLYSTDAILLPTMSNTPRLHHKAIQDYFASFLLQKPMGRIVESHITIGETGNWCSDNGIYEFVMKVDGSVVRARYTFMYQLQEEESAGNNSKDVEWKIVHHHSSLMPEKE